MTLDEFDHRILAAVQADNQRSHGQIGESVGLSASAVRRRLQKLRQSQVIVADVSVIAPELRGLSFITHVKLSVESVNDDQNFRKQIAADPAVSQCYSVSGDFDYVLLVHARTPQSYEEWGQKALLGSAHVTSYSSTLVWRQIKRSEMVAPA